MATPNSTNCNALDLKDTIDAKTKQLSALLFQTCGEAGEMLRRQSEVVQDHYMWACADLAREVVDALEKLSKLDRLPKTVQHG